MKTSHVAYSDEHLAWLRSIDHESAEEIDRLRKCLSEAQEKVLGQAHIEAQRDEFAQYAGHLLDLLRAAKCPNGDCDGKGTISTYLDGELTPQQCQWCFERDAALAKNPNPSGHLRAEPSASTSPVSGRVITPEDSGPVGLGPENAQLMEQSPACVHPGGCDVGEYKDLCRKRGMCLDRGAPLTGQFLQAALDARECVHGRYLKDRCELCAAKYGESKSKSSSYNDQEKR